MPDLFAIASRWEATETTTEERAELKELIAALVKYPCKISCQPNDGVIDIYVFSERRGKVCDWLELQPSGAIGVIFEEYADPDGAACARVNDACESYNEANGLEFDEGSGSTEEEEETAPAAAAGGAGGPKYD